MQDKPGENASSRIPVTLTTFRRLREFSRGLGASYDDTLDLLLRLVMQPDEDEMLAGRRLRAKLEDDEGLPTVPTKDSIYQAESPQVLPEVERRPIPE